MKTQCQRRIVRDLQPFRLIRSQTDLRTAARECLLNLYCGNRIVRRVTGFLHVELKASFVDGLLIDDCGFSQAYSLLGAGRCVLS